MTVTDGDDAPLADYLLGLMEPAESAAFEARLAADPALAREVAAWRDRLAELDATARPAPPSDRLWPAIAATLDRHRAPRAIARPAPASGRAAHLWRSLGFWRAAGFAGAAASMLLAIGIVALALRPEPLPRLVAVLMGADGGAPGAIVEIDADGRARLVPLVDIPVPQGRALQVWTLPSIERGPVSVGLIDAARGIVLDIDALPAVHGDQLFEITLEPAGGSPIGRPTGPILMKGLTATAL
jgi:anti-sigma-K factor RskA